MRAKWTAPEERNPIPFNERGWVEKSERDTALLGFNVFLFYPDCDPDEGYFCYDGDFEETTNG